MFNIEVIKLILRKKQEELAEINRQQGTINVSADVIDNLEKEINYLNLVVVRYEIARLLGLDNNANYISVNFLGIEHENVYDYNLTPEQMNEYNSLIAQIPAQQLQRYNVRREIASVVGEEISSEFKDKDYEGIEEINPSLVRYNLEADQIRRFTDLADSLVDIASDTTKRVNINEESINLVRDAFNELNINNPIRYNRIKQDYLDTIDILMGAIDENTKNNLFIGVSNHELAFDLVNKYPDLTVKLDMVGVENMLNAMNLSTMSDDKYDQYLEILSANIIELYEDDANKPTIEGFINGIERSDYTLRSDLATKLGNINNTQLDIQDNEYHPFINRLDQLYDNLSERNREKYYTLLKRRIESGNDDDLPLLIGFLNKDFDRLSDEDKTKYYTLLKDRVSSAANDLDRIERINFLLVQVTNKDVSRRLQNDFMNNQNIKFSNMHLSSYNTLIQDTITKLEAKKSEYQAKRDKCKGSVLSSFYDTKIKDIDKEIEKVRNYDPNLDNNSRLKRLNFEYNNKTTRIIALEKEIEELRQLKSQLRFNFQKKRIDKKIAKRTKMIEKLKQSKVKIVGKQKKIMLPKVKLERRKGSLSRHVESKSEVFSEYAADYRALAEAERRTGGFFGKIKALFYDLKAHRYEKKATFNRDMCDILRNGNVRVNGRNRHAVNRNRLNQVRNNVNQNVQVAYTI